MDFVAIDFETANHRPNSACQLAAVVVRESKIVEEFCWMIRPPSNQFSRFNIAVHGIRPADVAQAPKMNVIWSELQPVINQSVVIAHNARFDVSVLLASLAEYGVVCHDFDFHCTRAMARAAWPGRARYGLKPLASWLGIQFKHHDALEDSRACAAIALAVESSVGYIAPLEVLESRLGIRRGKYRSGSVISPRTMNYRTGSSGAGDTISRNDRFGFPVPSGAKPLGSLCPTTVKQSCVDKPLSGKAIVLLGPLRGLSMIQTEQLIRDLGAEVQSQISPSTNYVVTPGISVGDAQQQVDSVRATWNCDKSANIRVLSERQFRALLPGGSYSTQ